MSQISYHRNPNCAQFPLLRLIKYVLQRQRYRCNTIIMNSSERKVKKNVLVAPSCPTLCHPTDCGLPAPSVFGILQARILEQVTIFFSNNLKKQNKTKQENPGAQSYRRGKRNLSDESQRRAESQEESTRNISRLLLRFQVSLRLLYTITIFKIDNQ